MTLAAVRLAMMAKYATLSGVTVPQDPLPARINDKTIMIFPRIGPSTLMGLAQNRKISYTSDKTVDIEYHRRIPYERLGEVIADVTEKIDAITEMAWAELGSGGSRFGGTVETIDSVNLMHVGALEWNEWTFGARIQVSFTYLETTA